MFIIRNTISAIFFHALWSPHSAYASAGTFNGDSLEGVGRIMLYTNLSRSFPRVF
jgi:hypothetical protein